MRKTIMIIALSLIVFSAALAEVTIAYIDSDKILMESEDAQAAQKLFDTTKKEWQNQLAKLDEEIEKMESEFEARKLTYTEAKREEAKAKIEEKKKEREEFLNKIFGDNGMAMRKNSELLDPILQKLQRIIEEISSEQDIDMVFDATTSGIIYAVPKLDITDQVIEKMNEQETE